MVLVICCAMVMLLQCTSVVSHHGRRLHGAPLLQPALATKAREHASAQSGQADFTSLHGDCAHQVRLRLNDPAHLVRWGGKATTQMHGGDSPD
mmetsp:Transcript_127464/g.207630  ORF Transcript_127464/g.207630 Transcript_127464/m.207630 type:complete len:93 (+) Transcript_127464:982-1260(+)